MRLFGDNRMDKLVVMFGKMKFLLELKGVEGKKLVDRSML